MANARMRVLMLQRPRTCERARVLAAHVHTCLALRRTHARAHAAQEEEHHVGNEWGKDLARVRACIWLRGRYAWMAERVTVCGGGHPSRQAVEHFFIRVDKDPEWYPGKWSPNSVRPALLTNSLKKRIATSAMRLKKRGKEPNYETVKQRCPVATTNPDTARPFCRNTINAILTTRCYDHVPENPWRELRV